MTMVSAATAAALLLLLHLCSPPAAHAQPPASCTRRCGDVDVPYPFGIAGDGDGCYRSPGFDLTCDRTREPATLLLRLGDDNPPVVVNISIQDAPPCASARGSGEIQLQYNNGSDSEGHGTWGDLVDSRSPYALSEQSNELTVTGCNFQAMLFGNSTTNVITGCSSFCAIRDTWGDPVTTFRRSTGGATAATCSGIGCCQASIPIGRTFYMVQFRWVDWDQNFNERVRRAVIVAEQGWFDGVADELLKPSASAPTAVPMVLDWVIDSVPLLGNRSSCPEDAAAGACRSGNSSCVNVNTNSRTGYTCRCKHGYAGNPYVAGAGGCIG